MRVARVEAPPPVFHIKEIKGRRYFSFNTEIARRFFRVRQGGQVRPANTQVIPVQKPAGTKRILCLGESTTAGFPYPAHGAFPALLQIALQERDPSVRWEVVNLGVTAISSANVASMMREFLATDPDAVVVYLGHNEFYGAGGVATPGAHGPVAALRTLRTVRLLEKLLTRPPKATREEFEALENARVKAEVPPDSPMRPRAMRVFRDRIGRILSIARDSKVPIVLCEVVSNERDHFPFGGAEAERRYRQGTERIARGDRNGAEDLVAARNLDEIPFRAPDGVNTIIREEARRFGANLVAMERIFRDGAPFGSPGAEAFVEHLHPTFLGNSRIASAAADAVLGRGGVTLTPGDAARWLRASGLTRLDLAFADARIEQLLDRWPYKRDRVGAAPVVYRPRSARAEAADLLAAAGDSGGARYFHRLDEAEQDLLRRLMDKQTNLLDAHTRLAQWRMENNDATGAALELRAAVALYPVDPALWVQLARLSLARGNRGAARWAATEALVWDPENRDARQILTDLGAGP